MADSSSQPPEYTGSADLQIPRIQINASGTILSYTRSLLQAARKLTEDGQYSIATVTAHIACEIAVEAKLAEAFAAKKVEYLQEPIYDLLPGYNLGNPKVREVYTALTGDDIGQARFWAEFNASATRRNKVAHKGHIATKDEAELTLKRVDEFLTHLGI